MIKQNESELDKKIRLIVGVIALLLGVFVLTGTFQVVSIIIGVLGILTGLTGFCLLYKLLGIKTYKR